MSAHQLPDVQLEASAYTLALDAVGVSHLRHPIVVLDKQQGKQETVATITMSVDLAATARGAHLSRFLELLDEASGELTVRTVPRLLEGMRRRLGSTSAAVDFGFTYFIDKRAPVTGARGLLDVQCHFSFSQSAAQRRFTLAVTVPVTTLCPCSKAVSDYGAHNQRCDVTITVEPADPDQSADDELVWIEDLVLLAESHASAPIYPTLKRPDERYVTMLAYDRPAFVEDVVRGVASGLMQDGRIQSFTIEASSDESIHNHRAFARVGWARPDAPAPGVAVVSF